MRTNNFFLLLLILFFLDNNSVWSQNHNWKWAKTEDFGNANNTISYNAAFFKLPGGPVNIIGGHNIRAIWDEGSDYWEGEQFGEFLGNVVNTTPKAEVSTGSIAYMTFLNDVMMKTTNSGITWDTLTTPATECQHQSVLNPNEVILTSGNTMYKSNDGGQSWSSLWNIGNWEFISVDVNESGYGLCSRENTYSGRMAYTEDGGLNWTNINGVNTYYSELFMVDNSTALAIKQNESKLYRTTSLGLNWIQVFSEPIYSISQISETEFYAFTPTNLYYTSDGFATYEVRTPAVPVYSAGKIWFDSSTHGVSWVNQNNQLGDGYIGALFFETFDGGMTWQNSIPKITDSNPVVFLTNTLNDVIEKPGGDTLWIKSASLGFLVTEDGGINWKQKSNTTCLSSITSVLTLDTVYSLAGSALKLSTNGGLNCTELIPFDADNFLNVNISNDLIALHFTDFNTGFILSADHIFKTTDGGISFYEVESPAINNIRFWHWLDATTCYLIGSSIRWTSDAGETWNYIPSVFDDTANTPYIRDLQMLNESEGWLCSDNGLYHTTNGGLLWENIETPHYVFKVLFTDADNGTVIGNDGIFLTTADGGNSWVEHQLPALELEYMATTETKAFIFAESGDILIADLTPVSTLEGDINGDGELNSLDADAFIICFGCTQDCGVCDLDNDGIVGINDFMLLISML